MLFWLTSMIASVQLSAVVIVRFSRWTAPSPRNPDDPYGALHFTGTQSYAGPLTLGAPVVTLTGTTGTFTGGVVGGGFR